MWHALLSEPFHLRLLRQYPNTVGFDNYKYKSALRNAFLVSRGVRDKIDSHHVIPKQFKHHPTIVGEKFDVDRSYNLLYLPNCNFEKNEAFPFPLPIVHHGGHRKYNSYVLRHLNELKRVNDREEKRYQFWLLLKHLEQGINEKSIPWN